MIKQLLLASLLFFVAFALDGGTATSSLRSGGKCVICEDKVPSIRTAQRIILPCKHSCHTTCLAGWETDVVTNCPECDTPLPQKLLQDLKNNKLLRKNNPIEDEAEDEVPNSGNRKPIVSSASTTRNRILFMLGGCGVAAAVAYYFRDTIGDLVWGKKETQSEADLQKAVI